MKTVFQIILLLAATVALVSSQVQTEDFILSKSSSVPCDTIVEQSDWAGNCCALNRTDGGGCLLTVINGYCEVSTRSSLL
jgi:hypothetical protein